MKTPLIHRAVTWLALAGLLALAGCGSSLEALIAYTGGGLPPGEPDIGGVVLAAAPAGTATAAQAQEPVVGARVTLFKGTRQVGETYTGPGGYFRFENPASGNYRIVVTPPPGSGLRGTEKAFRHQYGRQTFQTIVLEREVD